MTVWIELGGRQRRVELPQSPEGLIECVIDGQALTVDVSYPQLGVLSLLIHDPGATKLRLGQQFRCVIDGSSVLVGGSRFEFAAFDPRSLKGRRGSAAGKEGPREVKAPMPGRVVRVMVQVGDEVEENQGVVVIEAMKMQNELRSPKAGSVVKLGPGPGETVEQGGVLVVVE